MNMLERILDSQLDGMQRLHGLRQTATQSMKNMGGTHSYGIGAKLQLVQALAGRCTNAFVAHEVKQFCSAIHSSLEDSHCQNEVDLS
jgi:hypothetical protein